MNFLKKLALTQVIKNVLSKVSADHKTTVVGVLGSALLAANIDYGKLIEGDTPQVTNAVTAVVLALIGYFTNKGDKSDATGQERKQESVQ